MNQVRGKLTIRKGVEVDYNHEYEAQIREWLGGKDFDFLMGSVHYIDDVAFDLHRNLEMTPLLAAQKYFEKVGQLAESGLFSVIGHFDLIRDYLPPGQNFLSQVLDLIDMAFERMVTKNVYLEINSRRKSDGEPYPSKSLVLRYIARGGELFSFGSDAHSASGLGIGILQAMDLLASLKPRTARILFN